MKSALRNHAHAAALAGALLLASSTFAGGTVTAPRAALSTDSPTSTRAGLSVLRSGGNAADAGVAVALALAVVKPQSGNLGGGGFLAYFDAKTGGVWILDFRETAPRESKKEMFATASALSRTGPLASGVPATVAGLEALHARFGSKKWADLVAPAVALAREGLTADDELKKDLQAAKTQRSIDQFEATSALFFSDGEPRGSIALSELERTLARLAQKGPRDFYEGDLAKQFVEALRKAGGIIGYRDMAEYRPVWRSPLRIRYGAFDLYTVPPPSGGGLVLAESLNIVSGDDLTALGSQTTAGIHLLVEAQRRAFIDRNRYAADPLNGRIPYKELLSPERGRLWRRSIDMTRAIATVNIAPPGTDLLPEGEHTTHFTIADAEGNVLSLTTTLGENFGSGFVVPGLGFLLNNAMDDFTASGSRPNHEGLIQGVPNQIDPGKRPASSLTPTIVLRDSKPFLALGSAGGPAIPTTILQVFLNLVTHGMTLADAIAAPRWHHQAVPEDIAFESSAPKKTVDALNAMGHAVSARPAIGDVHAIAFDGGRKIAVADPRHTGAAGGF